MAAASVSCNWTPMINENSTTGAVYCPRSLYDGCVYRKYKKPNNEHNMPTA